MIHPIFCIPKPTPKEELADPNKGQRWRVLVDGQMGNKLIESALEDIVYAAEAHEEVDGPEDEEPYIPLVCGSAITSRPAPSTLRSLQAQSALLEDVAQCNAL